MTFYAWTIRYRGRKDIKHVTTLARLFDRLRVLKVSDAETPSGEVDVEGLFVPER
jgi:hypothetical protein